MRNARNGTRSWGRVWAAGTWLVLGLVVAAPVGTVAGMPALGGRAKAAPEMDVQGNTASIPDGDTSPGVGDHTDFGAAAVTGGTVVRTFTILNTGDAALNLTGSPRVSVSGAQAAEFAVSVVPVTPVAAGESTSFQVTFDPAGGGTRSATLSIACDDSDENPYNFAIQGTGLTATEEPEGEYLATGEGIWSLTGSYDVTLGAYELEMDLTTDGRGRISGTGTYYYTPSAVDLAVTGSVKGSDGTVLVRLALHGTEETVADKEVLRIAIHMALTLDPDLATLDGVATVSRTTRRLGSNDSADDGSKRAELKGSFSTNCSLDLPFDMDSTYELEMHLSTFGTAVSGDAVLVLSNGDEYALLVRGKRAGDLSVLGLSGDPTDPGAKGIKLKAMVTTWDDGSAELGSAAGKLFGQAVSW